jgi:hypothetical protein
MHEHDMCRAVPPSYKRPVANLLNTRTAVTLTACIRALPLPLNCRPLTLPCGKREPLTQHKQTNMTGTL